MRLSIVSLSALSAVFFQAEFAMSQEITLRFGTVYQPSHEISLATDEFARLVEENSGGAIDVEVFYGGELGSEREMAEMIRAGGLEMVGSGLTGVGLFVPQLEVMEAFYTYGDIEDLKRVIEAISPSLNTWMEPEGFHLIGAMYQGPRNVLAERPVRSLSEMPGLRLRIPPTPLFIALGKAWGATPTSIPYNEAYTALETGVVDAVDGTFESMTTMGFSEVVKFQMMTRHNFYPQPIVASLDWWEGLSKEHQDIIVQAARDAADFQLQLHDKSQNAARDKLIEQGVEIIELDNIDEFREPVLKAMDAYVKDKGEEVYSVYQKMLEVAGSDQD